jgi:hypothetical protein
VRLSEEEECPTRSRLIGNQVSDLVLSSASGRLPAGWRSRAPRLPLTVSTQWPP